MDDHMSAVVRGCYFHLRSLGKLREVLAIKVATTNAVALVISKIDYGNSWGLWKQLPLGTP